jgi:hypothetical protein
MVWASSIDGEMGTGSGFSEELSEGTHTITASVTDSGSETAIAEVNITIEAGTPAGPLSVGVALDRSVYSHVDTVWITTTVVDNVGTVEGATVTVVIDFPKISVTKTALTDANGEAVVSYKINNRKTGTGTANITVTVTKAGYDDAIETTSFTVQ